MYLYEKSPLCVGENPFVKGENKDKLEDPAFIPPIQSVLGGDMNAQSPGGTQAMINPQAVEDQ